MRVTTPGGSAVLPGAFRYYETAPPLFARGDANGDGPVDITDAITVLDALFLGGGSLPCPNAADAR